MFGFRLPPEVGRLNKPQRISEDSNSSETSSESETAESSGTSDTDEDLQQAKFRSVKKRADLDATALYEDFMPDDEDEQKQTDASAQNNSTDLQVIQPGAQSIIADFSKYLAAYLKNSQNTSSQDVGTLNTSAQKQVVGKKLSVEPSTSATNESPLSKRVKKPTNKELNRLKRKANTLIRIGKVYNEKVQEFVKELNS